MVFPSHMVAGTSPAATDIVRISHAVAYDSTSGDADIIGIDAGGALRFATNSSTRLCVGTLIVLPSGSLEIRHSSVPLGDAVTAEIVIKDKPLDPISDPDQFGTGLISVDGRVTMHGAAKTPTFVRVAIEPLAGHATLMLERAVSGWRANERIFVPDTRQTLPQDRFDPGFAFVS